MSWVLGWGGTLLFGFHFLDDYFWHYQIIINKSPPNGIAHVTCQENRTIRQRQGDTFLPPFLNMFTPKPRRPSGAGKNMWARFLILKMAIGQSTWNPQIFSFVFSDENSDRICGWKHPRDDNMFWSVSTETGEDDHPWFFAVPLFEVGISDQNCTSHHMAPF